MKNSLPSVPVIYIIDDDLTICESLTDLFREESFEAFYFTDARDFLRKFNPSNNYNGCIIADVLMPTISGIELLQELQKVKNILPVLMMSGFSDVPMAVQAMQAGAKDFIIKPFDIEELLEKVHKLIIESQHSDRISIQEVLQSFQTLTHREKEVLSYILDGKLNKQIAGELNISMSTVELHRAKIMQKMKARTIAELVKFIMLVEPQL